MAFFISTTTRPTSNLSLTIPSSMFNPRFKQSFSSLTFPNTSPTNAYRYLCCFAAKQQSGPVKKRPPPSSTNKKRKKKSNSDSDSSLKGFSLLDDVESEYDEGTPSKSIRKLSESSYQPLPLPKPPAGFVVDDQGRVVTVSDERIVTIVDTANNSPLDCIIRRVFRTTQGDECVLVCPVDTPVLIMKSTNFDGWSAVSDEEVESILPTATYALAKIHMHLIRSGFCYTARGGFCYTEDDIFESRSDDGQDMDGVPTEGVEITCFNQDGSHYMIYTPSDPLLFVAVKDKNGQLQIADDELLEDPATVSAIDEETEFNALVEEEAALLESLMGER